MNDYEKYKTIISIVPVLITIWIIWRTWNKDRVKRIKTEATKEANQEARLTAVELLAKDNKEFSKKMISILNQILKKMPGE